MLLKHSQWSLGCTEGDDVETSGYYPSGCRSREMHMSHYAYACKTEGQNGISRLISGLCVNCLISIPEYSRLNHLDVHLVLTTLETSQN